MFLKKILFAILIGFSFLTDLVLGTSQYPKMLIIVCAIIALYELVSPYIYTPS
jgi:hypothetical protein